LQDIHILGLPSSNHQSAIWNIVNPISLSIGTAGNDKDIGLTMFQIADRLE
jgi:hypothetical protein